MIDTTGKPTTEKEITLWQRVTVSIRRLDKDAVADPAKIAKDALVDIKKTMPDLVEYLALMALRHIAREILRGLHKNGNGKSKAESGHRAFREAPTFLGEEFNLLQVRYPKAHVKGKPQGYALLEALTEDDWRWNIDQLLYDSGAKSAHAHQLQRWGERIKGFSIGPRKDPLHSASIEPR